MKTIYDDVVVSIDYDGGITIIDLGVNISADPDIIVEKCMSGEYKFANMRIFKRSFSRSLLKDYGYSFGDRLFRFKKIAYADIVRAC